MKPISEWASTLDFDGMLTLEEVQTRAVQVCTFASAFIDFEGIVDETTEYPTVEQIEITSKTVLSRYHWSLVLPLVKMHCQRAIAVMLEASRPLQVEVFGRSVSEIDGEIRQLEDDFSRRVFLDECWSI